LILVMVMLLKLNLKLLANNLQFYKILTPQSGVFLLKEKLFYYDINRQQTY